MNTDRPSRPRDAASVILVRGNAHRPEILMGRRRSKATFLPGVYVFPGGRVDSSDRQAARAGFELKRETETALRRHSRISNPVMLAIAGLRETWEETGLLVARKGLRHKGLPDSPFWQTLADHDVEPDVAALDFVMRALTPTISRKRFNTRFFMLDASDVAGHLLQDGELVELQWFDAEKIGELETIDVTKHAVAIACARWRDQGSVQTTVPFLHYRQLRLHIDEI